MSIIVHMRRVFPLPLVAQKPSQWDDRRLNLLGLASKVSLYCELRIELSGKDQLLRLHGCLVVSAGTQFWVQNIYPQEPR